MLVLKYTCIHVPRTYSHVVSILRCTSYGDRDIHVHVYIHVSINTSVQKSNIEFHTQKVYNYCTLCNPGFIFVLGVQTYKMYFT